MDDGVCLSIVYYEVHDSTGVIKIQCICWPLALAAMNPCFNTSNLVVSNQSSELVLTDCMELFEDVQADTETMQVEIVIYWPYG